MIGKESWKLRRVGEARTTTPLQECYLFLMLMGDVALLSVTLLGRGTIGHFH